MIQQEINSPSNAVRDQDFYIGWQPAAAPGFIKNNRKTVGLLATVIAMTAILLGISQKKFSTANFEFGVLTTVEGVYCTLPVPCIKVINRTDITGGHSYITIPLVGFGKHGAAGTIAAIENENNKSLNQKLLTIKGTLLYNDGKLLMQIDGSDNPVIKISNSPDSNFLPHASDLGQQTIMGEIVDPKCYFGVMKPGEGKPHMDCATRCILGGIPPVVRVNNEKGESNYYLLTGAHGESINAAVKSFVGRPVAIIAHVIMYDDWIVLQVGEDAISRISGAVLSNSAATAIACAHIK